MDIETTLESGQRADTGLLTTREAAAFLGKTTRTMEYWRALGKPPAHFKVGRACLYAVSDLTAFLAACRVEPRADG